MSSPLSISTWLYLTDPKMVLARRRSKRQEKKKAKQSAKPTKPGTSKPSTAKPPSVQPKPKDEERVKAVLKETGRTVWVSPSTLKSEPTKYVKPEKKEEPKAEKKEAPVAKEPEAKKPGKFGPKAAPAKTEKKPSAKPEAPKAKSEPKTLPKSPKEAPKGQLGFGFGEQPTKEEPKKTEPEPEDEDSIWGESRGRKIKKTLDKYNVPKEHQDSITKAIDSLKKEKDEDKAEATLTKHLDSLKLNPKAKSQLIDQFLSSREEEEPELDEATKAIQRKHSRAFKKWPKDLRKEMESEMRGVEDEDAETFLKMFESGEVDQDPEKQIKALQKVKAKGDYKRARKKLERTVKDMDLQPKAQGKLMSVLMGLLGGLQESWGK